MRMTRSVMQAGLMLVLALLTGPLRADPVVLDRSYAGNIDFVVTGATMRTQSNAGNACAITNGPVSASLSGIPAGSTIVAAYLYYGGSGPTVDANITFDGVARVADRTFTETFNQAGYNLQYFGGLEDITADVAAKGNGSYSFADLNVTNTDLGAGATYCSSAAVVAGWGMIVVYENASEPLRVVNLFDGLQFFRGGSISLTPSNFLIPSSGIDGKFAVLSWEGDVENSAPLNGFAEGLSFNGVDLTDGFNPANNQFNSTINVLSSNTTYGVDFDQYDVSSLLTAGDSSATTVYASGGDLVLLALEAISVTNTPVADMSISKTVSQTLESGASGQFRISVTNNGPSNEPASVTVTDTLDGNLAYTGFSSSDGNWSCGAVGQNVTCTYGAPVASGVTLADVLINVSVAAVADGTPVSNTATVAGTLFDNLSGNDSSTVNTTIRTPNLGTSTKTVLDLNGGDVAPGDTLRYTITLNESSGLPASGITVLDDLPGQISSFSVVSTPAGSTLATVPAPGGGNGAGQITVGNISVPAGGSQTIVFDAVVGAVSAGDVISNTAQITAPASLTGSVGPASVTALVNSIPGSGTKNLYVYFNGGAPGTLQRVVPAAVTTTNDIDGGSSISYDLTPQLARDLQLGGGVVPVFLCLDRQSAGGNRDVTVTLSSTGPTTATLGSATLNNILGSNGWQQVQFNVPVAAQTLLSNSVLRLTLANDTTQSFRRLRATTQQGGCPDDSRVELNANTVINVESVATFDAPYAGGAAQTVVFDDGTTTYHARTVISDPFGSFDITGASFELLDNGGSVVVGPVSMGAPVLDDVAAGERTYEYAFTVPAYTGSPYTLRVTADEGTEGTVQDIGVSGLQVRPRPPLLSVSKVVSTVAGGPAAANADPGQTLFFTLQIANMGTGPATSVEIEDAFRQFLALGIDSYGAGQPFLFIDGSPSSGLSLGTPEYSNDDGSTYTYSLVDGANGAAAGFDGEVTNFRLPMTGSMPPGSSFSLRYQMIVE